MDVEIKKNIFTFLEIETSESPYTPVALGHSPFSSGKYWQAVNGKTQQDKGVPINIQHPHHRTSFQDRFRFYQSFTNIVVSEPLSFLKFSFFHS